MAQRCETKNGESGSEMPDEKCMQDSGTKNISAVDKIGSFNRFGSVLGLERIGELLNRLGNPEKEMKYIHIAGTNGKGSVSRFIYSALRANGYSVGIYTSPFLTVFNERIEVDGKYIPDDVLEELTDRVLEKVNEMLAEGCDSPTEFEVITAIAFLYFAQRGCDFVVLEVGLGGRGDSTNIIEKPLVSIITSISYDHTDRLGNTLEEIAYEKAGIIKSGVPVVSNVEAESPEAFKAAKMIEGKAHENGSVLYDASKIEYQIIKSDVNGSIFNAIIGGTSYENVCITMLGAHQVKNAITALTALDVMIKNGDIRIEKAKLYDGLRTAVNIGRFEIIKGYSADSPVIVLDGAHNEAGAYALEKAMQTYFAESRVLMVTGMLRDKDMNGILGHFSRLADEFIATEPDSDRRLGADVLAEALKAYGKNCIAITDIEEAVKYALSETKTGGQYCDCDVILFAGSLYLIGKVRGILNDD